MSRKMMMRRAILEANCDWKDGKRMKIKVEACSNGMFRMMGPKGLRRTEIWDRKTAKEALDKKVYHYKRRSIKFDIR